MAKTKDKCNISCGVQVSTSVAKQLKTSIRIGYYLHATVALQGCYSKNVVTKIKKKRTQVFTFVFGKRVDINHFPCWKKH